MHVVHPCPGRPPRFVAVHVAVAMDANCMAWTIWHSTASWKEIARANSGMKQLTDCRLRCSIEYACLVARASICLSIDDENDDPTRSCPRARCSQFVSLLAFDYSRVLFNLDSREKEILQADSYNTSRWGLIYSLYIINSVGLVCMCVWHYISC